MAEDLIYTQISAEKKETFFRRIDYIFLLNTWTGFNSMKASTPTLSITLTKYCVIPENVTGKTAIFLISYRSFLGSFE